MMKTIRRQIITLLSEAPRSLRELSQMIQVKEKEIREHLPHVKKTVTARKRRFVVAPACCLVCGYVFKDRRRLTPPVRCPKCKGSFLQDPIFRIV